MFNSPYLSPFLDLEDVKNEDSLFNPLSGTWHLDTVPNTFFSVVDDVFTNAELVNIEVYGKRAGLEQGWAGSAQNKKTDKIRQSYIAWVPIAEITKPIYQKITSVIKEHNDIYFQYDLTSIEKLQYTQYEEGYSGFYSAHLDVIPWELPYNRKLSFVLQLSDPSEYEGGDLLLYDSSIPTPVKKQKGRICFFPSHVLHEVTPVTKGVRKTLVGWVYGDKLK